RIGPSRSFSFDVMADAQGHRAMDILMASHRGTWLLPIWPDVMWLGAALVAGSDAVPCTAEGFDFAAGGKALLYRDVNTWEVVDVDTVESDHLALNAETIGSYGPGDRLYPLRRALLADGAQITMLTD